MKTLQHGMLLDAKCVMDNALPELSRVRLLVPTLLHKELDKMLANFQETLCEADVSDQYEEITRCK